jgi:methylated-DNA-[protein]-cysteine S-methyltransferase
MTGKLRLGCFQTRFGYVAAVLDEEDRLIRLTMAEDKASAVARVSAPLETVRDDAAFAQVIEQIAAYDAGTLRIFDLRLAPRGTPFQLRVWDELCKIPYGETISYGTLADRAGGVARAVGQANGANPIPLIIPCHRVIGADGSMTGFGLGVDRKVALLAHEGGLGPQGRLF